MSSPAKLIDMGAYGPGDEEDDVMFDDLVDDYEDEDEAIDAVSPSHPLPSKFLSELKSVFREPA